MNTLNIHTIKNHLKWARPSFDQASFLHQELAKRLVDRLDFIKIDPKVILNASADLGYSAELLKRKFKASIINIEIEASWLKKSRWKTWFKRPKSLCVDPNKLALQNSSVDLIFSNLWLSRVPNLLLSLQEFRRILKPNGLLLFTLFGPDTLQELKQSYSKTNNDSNPFHEFLDMHHIGDILNREQFFSPVMDMEYITLQYSSIEKLFADIKNSGNSNALIERFKGLHTPRRLQKIKNAYENLRQENLPATFEIIYGHAWLPELSPSQPTNEIVIPISKIRGRAGKL